MSFKKEGDLIKKQTQVVPVSDEVLSQKLKAIKPVDDKKKKGPLRAVIPLHNMARTNVFKGFKKLISPKRNTKTLQPGFSTPKKKNQKKSSTHKPVASSTPNKTVSPKPSPATSPIFSATEKSSEVHRLHYSLDSSDLRKPDLHGIKQKTSSLSNLTSDKGSRKNSSNNFNSSGEIKKSNLPRIRSIPALNSRHGNQKVQPLLPQTLNLRGFSKVNFAQRPRLETASADKENILPA